MKSCGYKKGGVAQPNGGKMTKTMGFAKGGQVSASGPDTAGPQGKTMSQPVRKTVSGDSVQVRGVGAARARKATIY